MCNESNIKCWLVKIAPGYSREASIYSSGGYHQAAVVEYKGKNYLVDCTYSQYFTLKENSLDRIGVVGLWGCKVGTFMQMTYQRKFVALEILNNGWIEFSDWVAKCYFDGFTLSFRNGPGHKRVGTYTTDYTGQDYMNFLNGKSNQVAMEGLENLGTQRKL